MVEREEMANLWRINLLDFINPRLVDSESWSKDDATIYHLRPKIIVLNHSLIKPLGKFQDIQDQGQER